MFNELFDFNDRYRSTTSDELADQIDKYLTTTNNPPLKKYQVMSTDYGAEWEIADIDRSCTLPEGLTWDGKDQTVMNTNGIATDPHLNSEIRTWNYGGEMNTKPCNTIDEIVELFKTLLRNQPECTVNNSCNLHNHYRIPGLDVDGLKRVVSYYYVYRDEMIEVSDYIPTPSEQGYNASNCSTSDLKIVEDRYKHHTKPLGGSRHGDLPEFVLLNKLLAEDEESFHQASVITQSGVDTLDANAARASINTWQMRKSRSKEHADIEYEKRPFAESGTIEMRMHHGTTDVEKYKNSIIWDINILNAALNTGETPREIFDRLWEGKSQKDVLPTYIPVDLEKYKIFKMTKNDGSNARRSLVKATINDLKNTGKI
ncbi:hypothetical protein NVP2275O_469 [Vibrio phage 2.275.O._10N.286.54.E11]|nr:hypothetical protein NVP2275O_469 [Vibrio phage 2.275.O._10N.286.54.E11]